MHKRILLIAGVLLTILLAGCGTQSGEDATLPQFIGGTEGVVITFEANQPPSETFDGGFSPFDVVVRLENKGEEDVASGDAKIKITGVLAPQFNLKPGDLEQTVDEDLDGLHQDPTGKVVPGNFVFAEFTDFNHVSLIAGNALDFPLKAQVCYKYATTASTLLCSREDNLNPEPNGICEVSGSKPIANSGGPVQISNVVQTARSKDSVTISFDITHPGDGKMFKMGNLCTAERQYEDSVDITVETRVSGLSCSGLDSTGTGVVEGEVKTFGQTRTVTCTQKFTKPVDAVVPVTIIAEYDYQETAETSIKVKSSGE
jgi:hypothetical protein